MGKTLRSRGAGDMLADTRRQQELFIMEVARIGLDISKHALVVHAVDLEGQVTSRRRLRRGEIISFFSLSPCRLKLIKQ